MKIIITIEACQLRLCLPTKYFNILLGNAKSVDVSNGNHGTGLNWNLLK